SDASAVPTGRTLAPRGPYPRTEVLGYSRRSLRDQSPWPFALPADGRKPTVCATADGRKPTVCATADGRQPTIWATADGLKPTACATADGRQTKSLALPRMDAN